MRQTEKIVSEDWITHLGGTNREPTGWIAPRGKDFVAIDPLGRERNGTANWLEAEETLNEFGIYYLVTPYEPVTDSGTSKVYIIKTTPDFTHVKEDDFSSTNPDQTFHILPFPAPEELLRGLPGC